jgi:predicted DNA-binding protein (MmcQ/YjbR family)
LHNEYLTKEALEGFGDFKIGQVIYTVHYADDTVLMATEEAMLQGMIKRQTGIGRRYGMEMNVEKTKVMRISRQPSPVHILIDQKQLYDLEHFNHLGSVNTKWCKMYKENEIDDCHSKICFQQEEVPRTIKLESNLSKKLVKCHIWSKALCGVENWKLRKVGQEYLGSSEMWCWRRIEKISWADRETNEVLHAVKE